MSKVWFVATAHDEYRRKRFAPGDVVIDPFRMIDPQPGVTVRRLGENKPPLISLLVPTRGRPHRFTRMMQSAFDTALWPRRIEIVAWVDRDEPHGEEYPHAEHDHLKYLVGERQLLSACWNACAAEARGEILMHCGDDITFETNGWDQVVRNVFAESADKIVFAYGDDRSVNFPSLGTHGFVHRRWVDAVGYFVPPLFSSDWNDVWLTDVANMVGRARPLPEIVIEHHHYSFGKMERDRTHAEREERGVRDDVVGIYQSTAADRKADAAKLRTVMA